MQITDKFKELIDCQEFKNKKFLLAVSGGIDSMVMLHLFNSHNLNCGVAHCNFQLRGDESDADENFVREQASKLYFKIFVTRFETKEYAEENHLSIQMAARELRYNWFTKLLKAHQFDYLAVAHNSDDAMETFFINLGRGSGIGGLTGIRPVTDTIVRPLVLTSRSEIEAYAAEKQIPHREDSSNASDKYLRNYIRHKIIPGFKEVFPHFRETMVQNLNRLADASLLYSQALQGELANLVHHNNNLIYINISKLLQTQVPKTILYEILKDYAFSSAMVDDIFHAANAIPGKYFCSATHKLVKDREYYILSQLEKDMPHRFYIEEGATSIEQPVPMRFEIFDKTPDFSIEKDPATALLDFDKIAYPLMLRKWQTGDYFVPLGMKDMKKISDFFIDNKLSVIEKEETWLLTSGNQIVWIVGKRIDNRFKITESTTKLLRISLL